MSDSNSSRNANTGWFVGIIVALALLAIGYLVFSANSGPKPVKTSAISMVVEEPVAA